MAASTVLGGVGSFHEQILCPAGEQAANAALMPLLCLAEELPAFLG